LLRPTQPKCKVTFLHVLYFNDLTYKVYQLDFVTPGNKH